MTITVQGPDGATIEFPDGTSTEVMQKAMQQHYGAPKPATSAEKRDIFSPFADTVRAAGHRVAEDVREDIARIKEKPAAGRDFLRQYTQPFEAGGALRTGKELMDVAAAGTSFAAGAINIVSDPIEKATRFGGEKGISLSDALMGLGPEVGGANKLASLSKASRVAEEGGAAAGAPKPRVKVKAGSAPSPEAKIDEALANSKKPSSNSISEAQKGWAKSSGDPKHADRVAKLMEDGIELTAGQRAGGMAKRIEEANKSNPYVGQAIREQEQKALTSMNKAVFEKSLKAAGLDSKLAGEGRDFVKTAYDRLSAEYDKNAEHYRVLGDAGLIGDLKEAHSATVELPTDKRRQFESIMQRRVFGRMGVEPK